MNISAEKVNAPLVRNTARIGLAWQIVIGLVVGILGGITLSHYPDIRNTAISNYIQPAGDLFIKLIKMVVVPIVFTSMVVGIAGVGDGKSLGRIGLKTIVYFEVITTIAIILGLVFGNTLQPGVGADISQLGHVDISKFQKSAASVGEHHGFMHIILGIIPENVLASMSRGDLLPVLFFSVLFGLALQSVPKDIRQPVVDTLRGISDAMFKVTGMVMQYAPVGVAALIAITVANFGFSSLLPLLKLVSVAYAAIIVFTVVVLGVTARLFGFNIFTHAAHDQERTAYCLYHLQLGNSSTSNNEKNGGLWLAQGHHDLRRSNRIRIQS